MIPNVRQYESHYYPNVQITVYSVLQSCQFLNNEAVFIIHCVRPSFRRSLHLVFYLKNVASDEMSTSHIKSDLFICFLSSSFLFVPVPIWLFVCRDLCQFIVVLWTTHFGIENSFTGFSLLLGHKLWGCIMFVLRNLTTRKTATYECKIACHVKAEYSFLCNE